MNISQHRMLSDWANKQWLRSETKKDPDRILFWMLVASFCVYLGWRLV